MKFSIFNSVRSPQGRECTREVYLEESNKQSLIDLCKRIAAETDKDKRGELKKQLPIITWQAYFPGKRLNKEAQPSGLFMLDIDHVDEPYKLYSEKIAAFCKRFGIVYVGMTASQHGLRLVAKRRPEKSSIEENQRWLAESLGVEFDGVCKDLARSSFLVPDSYTYFMDSKAIWFDESEESGAMSEEDKPEAKGVVENEEMEAMLDEAMNEESEESEAEEKPKDMGPTYHGIPLRVLAKEWLEQTGGEPEQGERNARLYKLAIRMRYVCDFNQARVREIMPDYGLPKAELDELVASAMKADRRLDMPRDLRDTIENIEKRQALGEDLMEDFDEASLLTNTDKMPPLPPVIKEWCEIAPEDFKPAVVLAQLPILGALGSRLRAKYLDGRQHSPSFQVSLEAPQASGKSFLTRLVDYELAQMKTADEAARELERDYMEKMKKLKMLNVKVKKSESSEIPDKPNVIIRYVPATMSITKLFMRMYDAHGLHLFAFAPEIDTVYKAFKRGFSSFSDALRMAFDNDETGQDYASENSFSGNVRLFYNTLFSGTPKAMCRFYPDVEDGLVSRVLFVTLPDQFGKPMPVWADFTDEQKRIVERGLVRLNEITLQGDEPQPEYEMKMNWLNKQMEKWIQTQQAFAVKNDDRTRDIFCRRAAVVGFRAGMLAWFLYGEAPTPTIRRKVTSFSIWVANSMLNQHLLRFNVASTHSNVNPWEKVLERLPDVFSRKELSKALELEGLTTRVSMVLYKWRLLGVIEKANDEPIEKKGDELFRKIKK